MLWSRYSSLQFTIYPPSFANATGEGTSYEDDGHSVEYLSAVSAKTVLRFSPIAPAGCTQYTISTTGVGYAGMVRSGRRYSVFLVGSALPTRVELDGTPLPKSAADGEEGSYYRTEKGDTRLYLNATTADILSAASRQVLVVCT